MTWVRLVKTFRFAWALLKGYVGGGLINELIVHGPPGGGMVGMLDDLIVAVLGTSYELGFWGGLAMSVFFSEVRKIIEDGEEYYQMSDRERAVVRRYVRQEHPYHIYLYGRIDVEDFINLYFSGRYLAGTKLGESVFQAVSDIFELLPEIEEVALVA